MVSTSGGISGSTCSADEMPNLEHMKLVIPVHKECLNGASDLGIQHLSALSKVEVKIDCDYTRDSNYDPTKHNDGPVGWVASAINGAIVTHPNRPTVRFETVCDRGCEHFEHGVLIKWLKLREIGEERQSKLQMKSKQKDETDGGDEDEQTDEKEVAQKEGQR